MRIHLILAAALTLVTAVPHDHSRRSESRALIDREANAIALSGEPILIGARDDAEVFERDEELEFQELEKRRGGGGGGGKSGGGSSGGSSGSSSGGSRGSSSGSSGGSSGGSRSTSSSTSAKPAFGGGRYNGGATSPYVAGRRSPGSSIAPAFLIGGAGLGIGLAAGAAFAYGYYAYPYATHYPYHNRTTNKNDSLPVECFCQQYSACGCDDTKNTTTIDEMLKNDTVANITIVNGTRTVVINGTLPNGTESDDTSAAASLKQTFSQQGGFLAMGAVVVAMVWL